MKFSKFILFFVLFSTSCGSNHDAQPKSLTDMKSVLLYQYVDTDRFRLLACPYAVDLDIDRNCSNVFLTPEGEDYYFKGIPKQPLLFAPSQSALKAFLTVPIVVGGAVVSWVLLRKLRTKIEFDKRRLSGNVLQSEGVDKQAAPKVTDGAKIADTADKVAKTHPISSPSLYAEKATEMRELISNKEKLFETQNKLLKPKKIVLANDIEEGVAYAKVADKVKAEIDFMNKQFNMVFDASEDYVSLTFRNMENLLKKRHGNLDTPLQIFNDFKNIYNNSAEEIFEFYNGKNLKKITSAKYSEIIEKMHRRGDEIIEDEGDFFHTFTELIGKPELLKKIRASRDEYKSRFQELNLQEQVDHAKQKAKSNVGIADYLLAAVGGLLTGSYLPDKIPPLDAHLFTEREWKKLFARDDKFKKPLKVDDSYVIVKKLTGYLKRKGEKVVINEQVFFGLKN